MKKSRTFDEILRLNEDSDSGTPALVRTADEQIALWYHQYARRLRRRLLLWFRGSVAQHAEDAVNETFLRLYTALLDGESIDNPFAWVCCVARRLMLDEIARGRSNDAKCREFAEVVVEAVTTPDDVVCKKHQNIAFARALLMLSDLERTCLDLRASGMTLEAIGTVVNLRHKRVGKVVRRALRQLAEKVGE